MVDNELWEVLQSFKQAIDYAVDKVDRFDKMYEEYKRQLDERIHDLEDTVYEDIIGSTQEYLDEQDRDARFNEFNSKYGDKLSSYNGAIGSIEGKDDFDMSRAAFDAYDNFEGDKPDEGEYVDALVSELDNQISAIKKGLGLPADAEVTVTQDENGNTAVEADGEVVATESETTETPKEANEEKEVEIEDEDNPDEIAAFEEELKKVK